MWRPRLRRDITSATDGELVAAVARLERAGIVFGTVVFFGVALRLATVLVDRAADLQLGNWGLRVGDMLVVLGLLAVLISGSRAILYQAELVNRSNRRLGLAARMAGEAAERAATANARAAEANERTAKAELALQASRADKEAGK